MKQPVTSSGFISGSPKVRIRCGYLELGISRNVETLGRRRIHSTVFVCRKESSLASSWKLKLTGFEIDEELKTLINNLKYKKFSDNFSRIISNPNFLIACWIHIKHRKDNLTLTFDNILSGLEKKWFIGIARQMGNGLFQFSQARHISFSKLHGKLCSLMRPSLSDHIVEEGLRFLLDFTFESSFSSHSYGHRLGLGYHVALKNIKKNCKTVSWYMKADIKQQLSSFNKKILVDLLKIKVRDQAFIDLIYKYLRIRCADESIQNLSSTKIQQGTILSVLFNIYMSPFDEWMEKEFIHHFNKDKVNHFRLANSSFEKRIYYFRYESDFIVGVDGSKKDCIEVQKKISGFIKDKLGLSLNTDKIVHAENDSVEFLGYKIYKAKFRHIKMMYDANNQLSRKVSPLVLNAPISKIIEKLGQKGYAKNGQPKRNEKCINYQLADIIEYYKTVEQSFIDYYFLANNYRKFVARIHYILKYSCALTIASKMNLKTKKKVFRKYGKNISVKKKDGSFVSYPTPSYVRPKISLTVEKY